MSSVAFMSELNAEFCFKNIMHLRDRGRVRTLRPLFVYATGHTSQQSSDALVAGPDVTAASCLNCLSIFSQALLIDLRAPFHNRLSTPACIKFTS